MIFTIGHSNHSLETFMGLLKAHHIDVLVDIRSNPFSRFSPHFKQFEEGMSAGGVKYVFLGKELGGRPEAPEFYDSEGRVLYGRLAASPLFLEGMDRLMRGIRAHRVALMCGEEDPHKCHRRVLVGRALSGRGVRVKHIRGNGMVEDEEEFENQSVVQGRR
jgi:uncharacterized protein (DUF488 family)